VEGLGFLQAQPSAFDLVTIVDVLTHTGPLGRWIDAAARAIRPDGALVLVVDVHEGDAPWVLRSDGRYAHGVPETIATLERSGFGVRSLHIATVRRERDVPAQVACVLAVRTARGRS